MNLKTLLFERDAFKEDLAKYANSEKHFFHFSPVNRVGINPKYRYGTPIGVYGYMASEIYPTIKSGNDFFGHERRFCHVLELNSSKILWLQDFKFSSVKSNISKLFEKYKVKESDTLRSTLTLLKNKKDSYPVNSEGDLFWKLIYYMTDPYLYKISKFDDIPTRKSTIKMNTILREFGYDVIIDTAGTIHRMQTTQGIFLTKNSYNQVETIEQFSNPI